MKNFICLLPVAGASYEILSTKPNVDSGDSP